MIYLAFTFKVLPSMYFRTWNRLKWWVRVKCSSDTAMFVAPNQRQDQRPLLRLVMKLFEHIFVLSGWGIDNGISALNIRL